MFVLPSVFFRLISLHFLYILSLFLWWDILGVWTTLFALIPIVVFVYFFSLPFLVYLSILLCTFLSLFAMDISFDELWYNKIFWGIQSVLLSISFGCSVIKSKQIPSSLIKKQDYFKRCLNDEMVVSFDLQLHTIYYISPSACKLYGWSKKDLVGKSLGMIYPIDLFDNPPLGFWECLKNRKQWRGSVDIITKDQVICEEIACYTAIWDTQNQIVLIEKKILEIFIKQSVANYSDWFRQFYEESPMPMATINRHHQIALVNPSFIKEFSIKPIIKKTIFTHLFLDILQENMTNIINECFEGKTLSLDHRFPTYTAKFIFKPYYCSKYQTISQILFMMQKEYTPIEIYEPKLVNIIGLIKDSLTDWYLANPNALVKIFTTGLPTIWVDSHPWKKLLEALFCFVDQQLDSSSKKVILLCHVIYFQYFFRICFEGLPFSQKDMIIKKMQVILIELERIGTKYSIIEGEYQETVLLLEFYGNLIQE
ncbi:MAG: PAS domain-containing protein [Brevinema sp.]